MPVIIKQFLLALIPGSFVLGLSACDLVQAPDTGVWKGTAVFRDGVKDPVTCELTLDLSHTDETLRVYRIDHNCSRTRTSWRATTFDVKGKDLWRGTRHVGYASRDGDASFEFDAFELEDQYMYPAQRLMVSWAKVGEALEFTQEIYFEGRTQRVHAWLKKESTGSINWDGKVEIRE